MFLKAQDELVNVNEIESIDIKDVETGLVIIRTKSHDFEAHGFDAIEAVMYLRPSALEGLRFKWKSWAFHNMVGHPVTQILSWLGFKRAAIRFHDWTVPGIRDFKRANNNKKQVAS